jgi:hypothetical protein
VGVLKLRGMTVVKLRGTTGKAAGHDCGKAAGHDCGIKLRVLRHFPTDPARLLAAAVV